MDAPPPNGRDCDCTTTNNMKEYYDELIHKKMRVTVKDGRVIEGDCMCLDPQGNLILYHCIEYNSSTNTSSSGIKDGSMSSSSLGHVLIPYDQRVDAEIVCR
jgi:small nuclear ribonucleoprotein (snRNP)-like protein